MSTAMSELDPEWCWDHLQQARWYGGRGRTARLLGLTTLPWWSDPRPDQPAVRSVIAEVQYADGGPNELYHLLLAVGPGQEPVRDAAGDERTMLLLWHGLRRASRRTGEGVLQVEVAPGLPIAPRPELVGGEQSNTCIRYGDTALLKVFRRLLVGSNPDLEVHRAVTVGVARLLGSATAEWFPASAGPHDVGRSADLAMLVEQVPGARDGWTLLLEAGASGASFATRAREIGASLRTVHDGLRAAFGSATVPGSEVADRLVAELRARADRVPQLAPYVSGLERRLRALDGQILTVQRIHGDCHLGQLLLGSDDSWTVIDFEGEPLKPRAERVRPDSPWRDVAGVLRSFAYAAATLVRTGGSDPRSIERWAAESRNAFLDGYLDDRPLAAAEVLDAYEADRASYEVTYEAGHRPDWIDIPLHDVARLAESTEPEERP